MGAILWATMNALDVAFTEAAVGAGISTVLLLAAISRVGAKEQGAVCDPLLRRPLMSMKDRKAVARAAGRSNYKRTSWAAILLCTLVALALLDGNTTLESIKDALQSEFPDCQIRLRDTQQLIFDLHKKRLLVTVRPYQASPLLTQRRDEQMKRWLAALRNPLFVRFPGIDPDRFLHWLTQRIGWMFSTPCVLISLLFMLAVWLLAFVLWLKEIL